MGKELVWVLYDGRGEEEGSVACVAQSLSELKRDSQDWPEDYQWFEYDCEPGNQLVNPRFHSTAGKHWTKKTKSRIRYVSAATVEERG